MDVDNFTKGEISVRFEGISGRIDQGAGILFNLKTNGDYLALRSNPLENNLVLWKFENGRRSQVKWIRNTPTPTKTWHDLKVRINGKKIEGYLDGKRHLEHEWTASVSGRIGLWSKADRGGVLSSCGNCTTSSKWSTPGTSPRRLPH